MTFPSRPAERRSNKRVWTALREIPAGTTTSYGKLAERLGKPTASRRRRSRQRQQPDLDRRPLPPGDRRRRRSHRPYGGGLERKALAARARGASCCRSSARRGAGVRRSGRPGRFPRALPVCRTVRGADAMELENAQGDARRGGAAPMGLSLGRARPCGWDAQGRVGEGRHECAQEQGRREPAPGSTPISTARRATLANAGYWYRRAGKGRSPRFPLDEEWAADRARPARGRGANKLGPSLS